MRFPEYRIDAATNRDYLVDEAAGEAYLAHIADWVDLTSRGERVSVLRLLGRLAEAEREGRVALVEASRQGWARQQIAAIIRLAHVVQWQHEWQEADALFADALDQATRLGDPLMLAFVHQHAGRNHVDQGRYGTAVRSFRGCSRAS